MSKDIDSFQVEADTLPKLVKLRAEGFGNNVFMKEKYMGIWKSYSWDEVYNQIKFLALSLIKLGLKRGETVSIIGENRVQLYIAEYAAMSAGAVVVCLYPDMTPSEIFYILELTQAVYIFAEDQEQVDKCLGISNKLPFLRRIIYWNPKSMYKYNSPLLIRFQNLVEEGVKYAKQNLLEFEKLIEKGKGDDTAIVLFTSGTTGLPKGGILTHKNLLDTAYRLQLRFNLAPFTTFFSYMPPAWMTEQNFGITLGLVVPFIINFYEEPETTQRDIREVSPEFIAFGARQWESFFRLIQTRISEAGIIRRMIYHLGILVGEKSFKKKRSFFWKVLRHLANFFIFRKVRDFLGLSKVKLAMNGGSGLSPKLFEFFHILGVRLINTYGLTEYGMISTHEGMQIDPMTQGKFLVSLPFFGPALEWKIDENQELLLRGGSGFSGYFKNKEATEERIKSDGWYRTGDAGHIDDKGELVFLDRVKDLRRLASGHSFSPQFIEMSLRFSPSIKDAIAFGDERKDYVAAMINIDHNAVGNWAQRNNIIYSTFTDLSQNEEVCRLISLEIKEVNKLLPVSSRIRKFINLPKELDPDEAELTRSRKIRREFLENRYESMVENIYKGEEKFVNKIHVKYRDGRTGEVEVITKINNVD